MPNKTGAYYINAIEYPYNFFLVEKKISSNLPFVNILIAFLPGKISSEKRCQS